MRVPPGSRWRSGAPNASRLSSQAALRSASPSGRAFSIGSGRRPPAPATHQEAATETDEEQQQTTGTDADVASGVAVAVRRDGHRGEREPVGALAEDVRRARSPRALAAERRSRVENSQLLVAVL